MWTEAYDKSYAASDGVSATELYETNAILAVAAAVRAEALREAAKVCDDIRRKHDAFKGLRPSGVENHCWAGGANECHNAILALLALAGEGGGT